MGKSKARKAKQAATKAQLLHRAEMSALLWFGGLMVLAVAGGTFLMRGGAHQHGGGTVGHDEESLIDLENARCPTCAETARPDVVDDWHHLRVHLARSECVGAFEANPEKSLDASGIEWRDASRVAREINHSNGSAQSAALANAQARWHVLAPGAAH
jgi:hypothetical protein